MFHYFLVRRNLAVYVFNNFFYFSKNICNSVELGIFIIGVYFCYNLISLTVNKTFFHKLMVKQKVFKLFRCYVFTVG